MNILYDGRHFKNLKYIYVRFKTFCKELTRDC